MSTYCLKGDENEKLSATATTATAEMATATTDDGWKSLARQTKRAKAYAAVDFVSSKNIQ